MPTTAATTVPTTAGARRGTFATAAQEGAYTITVSWDQIAQVESISFVGADERTFLAEFFDAGGHDCGACGNACATGDGSGTCQAGKCAHLSLCLPVSHGAGSVTCSDLCGEQGGVCGASACEHDPFESSRTPRRAIASRGGNTTGPMSLFAIRNQVAPEPDARPARCLSTAALTIAVLTATGCDEASTARPFAAIDGSTASVALHDATSHVIEDVETGAVLETVITLHNLSNHCAYGCDEPSLGQPPAGEEIGILTLGFDGELQSGVFELGDELLRASLELGGYGCGIPTEAGKPGSGQPPGLHGQDATEATVTIASVELGPDGVPHVAQGDLSVTFDEAGGLEGDFAADHCTALDSSVYVD